MGREKLRQVVRHLEQRWERVSPHLPFHSAGICRCRDPRGHMEESGVVGPGVVKSHTEAGSRRGVTFAGLAGVLEWKTGPSLAQSQRLSLRSTRQFPGTRERFRRDLRVSSWPCTADSVSSLTSCNLLKGGTVKAPIWEPLLLEDHRDG